MAQAAEGYVDGWAQYRVEPEDADEICDECNVDLADGETYWTRDDEILCETCFSEWQEEEF